MLDCDIIFSTLNSTSLKCLDSLEDFIEFLIVDEST